MTSLAKKAAVFPLRIRLLFAERVTLSLEQNQSKGCKTNKGDVDSMYTISFPSM